MRDDGRDTRTGYIKHTDSTQVGTHLIPDSRTVQKPSMSLPAFMSSKPPPKLRRAESAFGLSWNRWGDERHVAHKIGAVISESQNEIKPSEARAHLKYFNHRVMSTTVFAFSSDLWIISSRQPTSCLILFATIISYSFIAVDENARFHGLRSCICNMGSR